MRRKLDNPPQYTAHKIICGSVSIEYATDWVDQLQSTGIVQYIDDEGERRFPITVNKGTSDFLFSIESMFRVFMKEPIKKNPTLFGKCFSRLATEINEYEAFVDHRIKLDKIKIDGHTFRIIPLNKTEAILDLVNEDTCLYVEDLTNIPVIIRKRLGPKDIDVVLEKLFETVSKEKYIPTVLQELEIFRKIYGNDEYEKIIKYLIEFIPSAYNDKDEMSFSKYVELVKTKVGNR